MEAPQPTYDASVRWCWRVIAGCEAQQWQLRIRLIELALEEAVSALLSPGRTRELEELRREIEQEIAELERLKQHAREVLAWLHRVHGPIRWARADSPDGGAEKDYYTGGACEPQTPAQTTGAMR
jgi:hypothetical protein